LNNWKDMNNPDYLKEKFWPLKYSNSANLFWEKSNFWIFVDIIKTIDDSINIKKWLSIDFTKNTLTIPPNIRYKDMPKLIKIIEEKADFEGLKKEIVNIKNKYLTYAKVFILKWENSSLKESYYNSAFKYFTIYSFYNKKYEISEIKKDFEDFIQTPIQINPEIENIAELILQKNFKIDLADNKNNFKLKEKDKKEILKIAENDAKKAFEILILKIEKYFNKNPELKNKQSVLNILKTTYKTEEILIKDDISENWSLIISSVIAKADSILNSDWKKDNNLKDIQVEIDMDVQTEIKRDFELVLYNLMTRDLSVYDKKIDEIIDKNLSKINKKKLKGRLFYSYLKSEFKENEIEKMMKWVKAKNFNAYINQLPSIHKKKIIKMIEDVDKIIENPLFDEIILKIKNKEYYKANQILDSFDINDKSLIILYIFTLIWDWFHNLFHKDSNDWDKYNKKGFEIKRLKKENEKLNCLTMSVLINKTIEKIFDVEWKWLILWKHEWIFNPHANNAIKIWKKYIIIDATFDKYYIKNEWDFDDLNSYDIDKFGNSYMTTSYYNIRAYSYDKYNESEFYKLFVDYFSKRDFEYLNELINQNSTNPYWIAANQKYIDI
jgi:hypothetical protein